MKSLYFGEMKFGIVIELKRVGFKQFKYREIIYLENTN